MFTFRGSSNSKIWPASLAGGILSMRQQQQKSDTSSNSTSINIPLDSSNSGAEIGSNNIHLKVRYDNPEKPKHITTSPSIKINQEYGKWKRLFRRSSTHNDQPESKSKFKNIKSIRNLSDATKSRLIIKADILFVAGGITTLIGMVTASMGVYPRNQAQIRLYLEIFGCLMIITGVIMILSSVKVRLLEKQLCEKQHSGDRLDNYHRWRAKSKQDHGLQRRLTKSTNRLEDTNDDEDELSESDTKFYFDPHMNQKVYERLLGPSRANISSGLSVAMTVSTLIAVRRDISNHFCFQHVTQHIITSQKQLMEMWYNLLDTPESTEIKHERERPTHANRTFTRQKSIHQIPTISENVEKSFH